MCSDNLPTWIGPAEFSKLGNMIAVRCPSALDPLLHQAGATWEPGGWRHVQRRRLGLLKRATDPWFRQAGVSLDVYGDDIVLWCERQADALRRRG